MFSLPSHSEMVARSMPLSSILIAQVCRLCEISHKRHYVDGWVMWPVGVFPLAAALRGPVPAT